ncbi:MAG TPA: ChaN family lipoprotein, partial [Sphingomonadales bacterium]
MTRHSPAALIAAALALILLAASCAPPPPRERAADQPLVDRIWSRAEGRFMTSAELLDRMAAARFVLLGEVHDNPHHHQLQAWAVKALAERNRKLALVAEMIAADQAPGLALFEA